MTDSRPNGTPATALDREPECEIATCSWPLGPCQRRCVPDCEPETNHPKENTMTAPTMTEAGAYRDAVAALQEVTHLPLSTTLGQLIRQGYLIPNPALTPDGRPREEEDVD